MNTSGQDHFIRVEKGSPSAEELAALTAVVLAVTAARTAEDGAEQGEQRTAGWRRPERQSGFRGPRTWRENAPVTVHD
ncbi:acyl-CoA carboxylase subunit epsilon [Streptomyces sp. MUM 203J]|uniref:acyl-CoA carboxylase subunit epsilon n=1 Tax=Streptomyces sp. MUM 203J TaxID=2791990 RepID=UPI001F047381|nr:acyl-CoA carboxylase subunit epsilon [Streptomyces sp. MUM 203J]MCH0542321.1 acyl-CoA carboxylase subunit epsilon [Streptomyces sp. MUM 203J]